MEEITGEGSNRKRQKLMRRSEKILSQQMSESTKSESFNSSMLANLSLETIISEHENVELDLEFSTAGKSVREIESKRTLKAKDGDGKTDSKVYFKLLTRPERVNVLNGRTLICIIYCALNICGSKIQLTDLLRFILEGRISFYNNKAFFPEDFIDMEIPLSHEEHHTYRLLTYESIRLDICHFVRAIPDLASSLIKPNLIYLCGRYLVEMNLPLDLLEPIERLINFNPPNMAPTSRRIHFFLQNYEGRAMAFIIFVLKLIFGLDGHREEELSTSARNINETLEQIDDSRKIFVYKDWMEFIEYRQEILARHYHPMLFSHDVKCAKPYESFKKMLDALNQKFRNLEKSRIDARDKTRVTSKMNAEDLLTKLGRNHEEKVDSTKEPVPSSFTPFHDVFQQLLKSDKLEINRKIASKDFSRATCEYFIDPLKLIEICASVDTKITTIKSSFPHSYVFYGGKTLKLPSYTQKFKLSPEEVTEEKWREDLKKRYSTNLKEERKKVLDYHEKTNKWVLEKRKIWRELIRDKTEYDERMLRREQTELESEEPLSFHEETIFPEHDAEIENIDKDEIEKVLSMEAQLEKVFKASERLTKIHDKKTFVVPDFNLWHRSIIIQERNPSFNDHEIETLPKNFIWLLKFCASVLRQQPLMLYYQLLCIESQYVNVYAPVELMYNTMRLQNQELKPKHRTYRRQGRTPW